MAEKADQKVLPKRTPKASATPRKRASRPAKVSPRPWAKILGWGWLVFLLFGSMLAVFLTIFFSVP